MLDVLIIGAGMCGQTAAFALMREGVRNMRIVDRAERGREGPWGTYARMDTLRSPKHLTGPDLGFPALTFRAWYEAQQGAEGWQRLYKVATRDWLAYLLWVRDTVGLNVENGTEVTRLDPAPDHVRVELATTRGPETIYARKVVLAGGRDGSGAPYWPAFPSLPDRRQAGDRVFHSSDAIDFARFKGGKVGVLGASASAFDNAAVALESGAAEAHLFVRRPHLPQINKSKWTVFPGFFHGYPNLDDRTRWQIYAYIFSEGRATAARVGAALRPACGLRHAFRRAVARCGALRRWRAGDNGARRIPVRCGGPGDRLRGRPRATTRAGAFLDKIALWADRVSAEEAALHPAEARHPYLGPGFELTERMPGSVPGLSHLHCFNAGSTMSHAAVAGDIPGLAFGATRLSRAIAGSLFLASADVLVSALHAHDDRELEPTRYFLPR